MSSTPDEREPRGRWFDDYCDALENHSVREEAHAGVRHACPCCRCRTLSERGGFEICPVCFWEDDGQNDDDDDKVRGGPNGSLSLTAARSNYRAFGACEENARQHARPPRPGERPDVA